METGFPALHGALFITSLISRFIIDPRGNIFPYLAFRTQFAPPAARGLSFPASPA
jgi:hypothetical protein